MKKSKNVLYIIIGILLIPVVILLSPVLLIIHFKGKKSEKQRYVQSRQTWEEKTNEHRKKQFSTPYIEPVTALPDEVFAEKIGEFTCLQFLSCNDLSGGIDMRELIASEHPETKERILTFFQEYPIIELMRGERYANAHDVNHWKIRFIFEESQLNRTISGYGCTELTAPYLYEMQACLLPILSDREQAEKDHLRKSFEADMRRHSV